MHAEAVEKTWNFQRGTLKHAGTMEVGDEQILVGDPIGFMENPRAAKYPSVLGLAVQKGPWHFLLDERDGFVMELVACHVSEIEALRRSYRRARPAGVVCIDTGTFQFGPANRSESVKFSTSTGFGDGAYEVLTRERNGLVTLLNVEFIRDEGEDEDEDEYDDAGDICQSCLEAIASREVPPDAAE